MNYVSYLICPMQSNNFYFKYTNIYDKKCYFFVYAYVNVLKNMCTNINWYRCVVTTLKHLILRLLALQYAYYLLWVTVSDVPLVIQVLLVLCMLCHLCSLQCRWMHDWYSRYGLCSRYFCIDVRFSHVLLYLNSATL